MAAPSPFLGNGVIYRAGAARWADTMQLFRHSSTAEKKELQREPALAGMLGWEGGKRAAVLRRPQLVRAPAICRPIPLPAAGHGDAGIKA